jgi:hypothetical protein
LEAVVLFFYELGGCCIMVNIYVDKTYTFFGKYLPRPAAVTAPGNTI